MVRLWFTISVVHCIRFLVWYLPWLGHVFETGITCSFPSFRSYF